MKFYYRNFFHKHLRPDTEKSYNKAVRQLRKNCDVDFPDQISHEQLLLWRKNVVDSKIKPVTWNSYLRHLKCIYKFGIELGLLNYKENPFNKLFLRAGRAKRKVLTTTQLNKLDFFLKGEDNLPSVLKPLWFTQTVIYTFRFTAIRRAQLLRLKVDDVDLSRKIIHISPEINKNHEYNCIPISEKLFPYIERLVMEIKKRNQCSESQLFKGMK